MLVRALVLFAFAALSAAVPEHLEKRQDLSQLVELASVAGIALPTDPAVLLQLGPFAQQLASALPTPSVLSVLETAAPKSFISRVLHDQSFANSFQTAFAAGSSPSWFNALPTDVKAYMHTYSGFGGIQGIIGGGGTATATTISSQDSTGTAKSHSVTATPAPSSTATGSASSTSMESDSSGTSSTETSSAETSSSSSSSSAGNSPSSAAAGETSTSSTATNAAARPTGAVAAGLAGVVGILGLAVAL